MANEVIVICKSIFKSNDKEVLAKALNEKWIELINQQEDSKKVVKKVSK